MAPKEAYLSIKAHKSREDAHYSQMAAFVSAIANAPRMKNPLKAQDLYEPQLVAKRPEKKTASEVAAEKRGLKERIEELGALAPPPGG